MTVKRTLSEAAAEILKSSASGAPAQPQQHLEGDESDLGTGEDLGGDFPDKVKETNPDATKPIGKAKEPGPRPRVGSDPKKGLRSNNSGLDIDKQKQGPNTEDSELDHVHQQSNENVEYEDEDVLVDENGDEIEGDDLNEEGEESVILFDREAIYESFKEELDEDIGSLLEGDTTLTQDFKNKVRTVFEAAVMSRVDQMADALESAFVETLAEAIEEIKGDLSEKTNDYLSYVAEQWLTENEIAIEKSLRTELTEDFISGLKQLFEEHYIDIPEDKVNVVEELTGEVSEIEERLNEEISKNVELSKAVKHYQASEIFATVCEGLTDVQVDKMQSLAEGIEFTTADEFEEKLGILKDNYFTAAAKSASSLSDSKSAPKKVDGGLNESILEIEEDGKAKKVTISDHQVGQFAAALDRTK